MFCRNKKVLEAIRNVLKKLTLDDKPPLLAIDKILIEAVNLGEIAVKYLSNAMKKNVYDTTYGLKPIEGLNQFKLGNIKVDVLRKILLKIESKLYKLGEEEWKLLTLKDKINEYWNQEEKGKI